jgi:phytanoyl-CoA hydroxylase
MSSAVRWSASTGNRTGDGTMLADPDHPPVTFARSEAAAIREYYAENGFVVIRGLIERPLIDAFLIEYERIKRARLFVYHAQSTHRVIRPELNEHGFIRESIMNASRLAAFGRFSGAIQKCIYNRAVSDALQALDGHERHVAWQDMFFDLSTGTIEHADTWYLDTDPPGSLVGAWFALEDIDPRAGTFFVMPGSHRVAPLDKRDYAEHEAFRKATLKFVADHGFRPQGMAIERGDVILWHPFLIHGAFSNQDPRFSRKSLTAHFLPYGARRQAKAATPLEPTLNPKMFRVKHPNDTMRNLLLYGRFVFDSMRGRRPKMDMRRKSY